MSKIVVLSLLGFMGITLIATAYWVWPLYAEMKSKQEEGDRYWELLRKDIQTVEKYAKLFKEEHKGRNASELFQNVVPWYSEDGVDPKFQTQAVAVNLNDEQIKLLFRCFNNLVEGSGCELPRDIRRTDLRWMSQLVDYDYWSIDKDSPNEHEDMVLVENDLVEKSQPNYDSLLAAGKLRLLVSDSTLEQRVAAYEVMGLSRLIMSNNYYEAKLYGISLLEALRLFLDSQSSKLTNEAILSRIPSQDEIYLLRRYFEALPHYFFPYAGRISERKSHLRNSPGMCSSMRVLAGKSSSANVFVRFLWAEDLEVLHELFAHENCGLAKLRRSLEEGGNQLPFFTEGLKQQLIDGGVNTGLIETWTPLMEASVGQIFRFVQGFQRQAQTYKQMDYLRSYKIAGGL